jgi:hypothetical protein
MLFKKKKRQREKVADVKENAEKCQCNDCPTNPDQTLLYCARGITSKPQEQVRALGCSCPLCHVFHEYKLSGCYLCLTPPKINEP